MSPKDKTLCVNIVLWSFIAYELVGFVWSLVVQVDLAIWLVMGAVLVVVALVICMRVDLMNE